MTRAERTRSRRVAAARPARRSAPDVEDFDVDDPSLTRFDLVREGARRDGVEIVHYEPAVPGPGTKLEKRIVAARSRCCSMLSGLLAFAFVAATSGGRSLRAGQNASEVLHPDPRPHPRRFPGAARPGHHRVGQETAAGRDRGAGPARRRRPPGTSRSSPAPPSSTRSTRPGSGGGRCSRWRSCCPAGGLGVAAVAPLVGSLIKNPNHPTSSCSTRVGTRRPTTATKYTWSVTTAHRSVRRTSASAGR